MPLVIGLILNMLCKEGSRVSDAGAEAHFSCRAECACVCCSDHGRQGAELLEHACRNRTRLSPCNKELAKSEYTAVQTLFCKAFRSYGSMGNVAMWWTALYITLYCAIVSSYIIKLCTLSDILLHIYLYWSLYTSKQTCD